MADERDICEGRHGGAATSVEGHAKAARAGARRMDWVLRTLDAAGPRGLTSYEIKATHERTWPQRGPVGVHKITPVLSRLAADGLIKRSRRCPKRPNADGNSCAVWVTNRHFI